MDDTRQRLLYRSKHRGTREADRLVGGFAQAHLNDLDATTRGRIDALPAAKATTHWQWWCDIVGVRFYILRLPASTRTNGRHPQAPPVSIDASRHARGRPACRRLRSGAS